MLLRIPSSRAHDIPGRPQHHGRELLHDPRLPDPRHGSELELAGIDDGSVQALPNMRLHWKRPNEPAVHQIDKAHCRGRYHNLPAFTAIVSKTGWTSVDEAEHAAFLSDLEAAMKQDYPMAFNNMAITLKSGEGVENNEKKAADLYVQTFTRVPHCCWVPVARHILAEEDKRDKATVRRVVTELTRWAVA